MEKTFLQKLTVLVPTVPQNFGKNIEWRSSGPGDFRGLKDFEGYHDLNIFKRGLHGKLIGLKKNIGVLNRSKISIGAAGMASSEKIPIVLENVGLDIGFS